MKRRQGRHRFDGQFIGQQLAAAFILVKGSGTLVRLGIK
jgi:hypothetical protein